MSTPYPLPTDERRATVQELSDLARELDAEADARDTAAGAWNSLVRDDIRRAAGLVRFVATLIVQGNMSTRRARFWLVASRDYLRLVRRADRAGVIR